jgi:hypothetical protein
MRKIILLALEPPEFLHDQRQTRATAAFFKGGFVAISGPQQAQFEHRASALSNQRGSAVDVLLGSPVIFRSLDAAE